MKCTGRILRRSKKNFPVNRSGFKSKEQSQIIILKSHREEVLRRDAEYTSAACESDPLKKSRLSAWKPDNRLLNLTYVCDQSSIFLMFERRSSAS